MKNCLPRETLNKSQLYFPLSEVALQTNGEANEERSRGGITAGSGMRTIKVAVGSGEVAEKCNVTSEGMVEGKLSQKFLT